MKQQRLLVSAFIALTLIVLLASCAANQPPAQLGGQEPGFWLGLWQGFIAPITFIISLFTDTVRI